MTPAYAKCPHCDETLRGESSPRTVEENAILSVHKHVKESHPHVLFMCERRREVFRADNLVAEDFWYPNSQTCSYCGSLRPDEFFAAIEAGKKITPTDKSYKAYIDNHQKFYFQHLSSDEQQKLIDLINAGKVQFEYPGRFYVLPYFMTFKAPDAAAG
jgi:hypothetical protein